MLISRRRSIEGNMVTKLLERIPFDEFGGFLDALRTWFAPRAYTPSALVRKDFMIAGLVAAVAAAMAYTGSAQFDPLALLTHLGSYFSADSFRVLATITD